MSEIGADDALRRYELDGLWACLGTALLALVSSTVAWGVGPALNLAAGVLGGGLLVALSYRSIKGVAGLVAEVAAKSGAAAPVPSDNPGDAAPAQPVAREGDRPDAPESRQEEPPAAPALSSVRRALIAVKFLIRYALLAVGAYVMLMRFHLHPVGLLAGALAPFLAAVMQVGRLSRARARRHTP